MAFLAVLLVSAVAVTGVARPAGPAPAASDAVRTLPAGDMIMSVDVDALVNKAVPGWLADNPDALRKFNESLAKTQRETGVDLRKVRDMALSMTFPASGDTEFAAVMTGAFDMAQMAEALKTSKNAARARTETYGGTTLHIFAAEVSSAVLPKVRSGELAFASPDAKTVVAGTLASVRAAIDARAGRAPNAASNAELLAAFDQAGAAGVGRFALKMPEKLIKAEREKDPHNLVLQNLSAIRYVFGSLDVATGLGLKATARTGGPADAKPIYDALNGLLALGRMWVGTRPDLASMSGVFDRVNLAASGADVLLVVDIPVALLQDALKATFQQARPAA